MAKQVKSIKTSNYKPLFGRENYRWMIVGLAVIVLGLLLMIGGKSKDPNVFDPSEVYSFRRITVAPILILTGLVLEIVGIFKSPKLRKPHEPDQAIIIAIVEGLTEFLPVSSTAHMKFANPLIGVQQSAFTDLFEIVIQLAAILSVVVLYYKQFFDFKKIRFYFKLVIALIPAIIGGLLLKKHIDAMLGNLVFIAIIMIAGGIVLLFIDRVFTRHTIHTQDEVSYKNAFIIGCYQVLSILFPGLSRSAATIIGGLQQKLDRRTAAEFSFFLAVPTMLAASTKSFLDVHKTNPEVFVNDNMTLLAIGSVVAFIVALLAIKFFITYLQRHGFKLFGYYRILAGTIILLLIWKGVIHQ